MTNPHQSHAPEQRISYLAELAALAALAIFNLSIFIWADYLGAIPRPIGW